MTDQRVCVVTGGAAGLGRAVAARFAAAGHATVLVDRDGEACAATLAKLGAAGGEVAGFPADVTDEEAVTGVAAALRERYGRVDVLVNNAGYATREGSVVEMTRQAWDLTIAVNLTGPFLMARHLVLCRARLASFKKPKRIVFVGSIPRTSVGKVDRRALRERSNRVAAPAR